VRIDPLDAECPVCHAKVRYTCVRVSGPYGEGQPLRRMHTARFRQRERDLAVQRAQTVRAAHAPGTAV
jgi:hypothetical protein